MKKQSWDCTNVNVKLQKISSEELKQRLAELWRVLLKERCQFVNSNCLVPVRVSSRNHGSPLTKRKTR